MAADDRLAELRAEGWTVAVHNDYRMGGRPQTFWLLTHPDGRWIKGEGPDDASALERAAAGRRAANPTVEAMSRELAAWRGAAGALMLRAPEGWRLDPAWRALRRLLGRLDWWGDIQPPGRRICAECYGTGCTEHGFMDCAACGGVGSVPDVPTDAAGGR